MILIRIRCAKIIPYNFGACQWAVRKNNENILGKVT